MDGPVRKVPTTKKGTSPPKPAATDETEETPRPSAPPAPGPAFARSFPRDPKLDRLVALFDQGNYAAVQTGARALVASSKDEAVRAAANELLTRLKPDPLALYLVATAAALLAVLAGWYWTHPVEPPPAAPAASAAPVST